jgi:hypothetical protein
MIHASLVSASGRGCVKTHTESAPENVGRTKRAVVDYLLVRKGRMTPENEVAMRFHTASVEYGS